MSAAIYNILEDLRHLPGADVSAAARFIHELREKRSHQRSKMIAETSGSLSGPDGDAFEAAIKDCDHIDEAHASW